jgi:zona occludens toxin (predicted ATPase)
MIKVARLTLANRISLVLCKAFVQATDKQQQTRKRNKLKMDTRNLRIRGKTHKSRDDKEKQQIFFTRKTQLLLLFFIQFLFQFLYV